MVENIDGVSPNLEADAFSARDFERFLQRNVELVEGRPSSRVSFQIAVHGPEVHSVAGESVQRAIATGTAHHVYTIAGNDDDGGEEGVLNARTLGRREARGCAGGDTGLAKQCVRAVKRCDAGGGQTAIGQHIRPLFSLLTGAAKPGTCATTRAAAGE